MDAARLGGIIFPEAGIVGAIGNDKSFAVFRYPSCWALSNFDAQAAKSFLLATRCDGVVEFVGGFIEDQERPEIGLNEALHVFKDGAQDGVEVEAGG